MKKTKGILTLFIKFLIIKVIDFFTPRKGNLASDGFYIYKNILKKNNLETDANQIYNQIIKSEYFINRQKKIRAADVENFNDILKIKPNFVEIIDGEIISHIRTYFGNDIKLDYVYIGTFFTKSSANHDINAGFFHHDTVGNRCKLFIPINPTGTNNSPTVYVKGTNNNSWGFGAFDSNYKRGHRLESMVKKEYKNSQISIKANFGDAYIFDTNGIHKGSYNQSDELRCIIQFEFSRFKSILRGDVGPGTFYMDSKAYNYLNELNLLRNERIVRIKDLYMHKGLKHKKKYNNLEKIIN